MFFSGLLASPLPYLFVALIYFAGMVTGNAQKSKADVHATSNYESLQTSTNSSNQIKDESFKFHHFNEITQSTEQTKSNTFLVYNQLLRMKFIHPNEGFSSDASLYFNFLRPPPVG